MTEQHRSTTAVLFSVSALVLTLFLFSPARIYTGNFKEFSAPFGESALVFLAVSLGLTGVLFPVFLLASRKAAARRIIVSLLVMLAFLAWVQGILPWQYGVLDGKDIDWGALNRYGIIDTVLWVGLLAAAVAWAGFFFRYARLASLLLILVQVLSALQMWIAMPKDQGFREQEHATDTLFQFSKHVNVIIVVLDTFQSDIFQDVILEDADLRSSFDGFTYFRNALAGSDGTLVSVPNMLTASNYDNSVPYLEYVKRSFLENSLPRTLAEYGFSIDAYPIIPYSLYTDFSGLPPRGRKLRDWDAFAREQAFIADLALFRSLPHDAKRAIYNSQRWFLTGVLERCGDSRRAGGATEPTGSYGLKYAAELENSRKLIRKNWDATFINRMIPGSSTMEGREAFKFYHLNGIHLQLMMNESLEYEGMPPDRASMQRQGTAVLKIVAILLGRLRQLEVFHNSLIFVVGDHGSGMPGTFINESLLSENFNTRGPYKGNFRSFKAAGIPMILVKRINATGKMGTSDAPVCLADIPQTVVEELGLEGRFPGHVHVHREGRRGAREDLQGLCRPAGGCRVPRPPVRVCRERLQLG